MRSRASTRAVGGCAAAAVLLVEPVETVAVGKFARQSASFAADVAALAAFINPRELQPRPPRAPWLCAIMEGMFGKRHGIPTFKVRGSCGRRGTSQRTSSPSTSLCRLE